MGLAFPKIAHTDDAKHVRFSHQLVCVICGNPEVHYHHLMRAKSRRGQYRSSGRDGLPLCPCHHNVGPESLHERIAKGEDEPEFFARHGINDPYGLAADLHAHTGDYEACMAIIASAKSSVSETAPAVENTNRASDADVVEARALRPSSSALPPTPPALIEG
jgi:hypothetical protein